MESPQRGGERRHASLLARLALVAVVSRIGRSSARLVAGSEQRATLVAVVAVSRVVSSATGRAADLDAVHTRRVQTAQRLLLLGSESRARRDFLRLLQQERHQLVVLGLRDRATQEQVVQLLQLLAVLLRDVVRDLHHVHLASRSLHTVHLGQSTQQTGTDAGRLQ